MISPAGKPASCVWSMFSSMGFASSARRRQPLRESGDLRNANEINQPFIWIHEPDSLASSGMHRRAYLQPVAEHPQKNQWSNAALALQPGDRRIHSERKMGKSGLGEALVKGSRAAQ